MIYINIKASDCELTASNEEEIEFALEEVLAGQGMDEFSIVFE